MAITIQEYTKEWIPAVRQFNNRLAAGGAPQDFRFPESHIPIWLPKIVDVSLYQRFFLAVEEGAVRGAYILKYQEFSFNGATQPIAYYHLPLSEGIVNKAYTGVGVQMLRNVLKTQPLVFALGMGGYDQPLPRMLKALGWKMCSIPFLFKVIHPARFMRGMQALRKNRVKRLLMDFAWITGSGWVGIKALQKIRGRRTAHDGPLAWKPIESFAEWADEIWIECKASYAMAADRCSTTLNILYPASNKKFLRLMVTRNKKIVGWAVLMDTPMQDDKYFGNLRVGSIVDCFASPENVSAIIQASTKELEKRGVDLVVSNQSHASWFEGLKATGFLTGPSNFIFAGSKKLGELLAPFEVNQARIHFTRGDGDGPIHL